MRFQVSVVLVVLGSLFRGITCAEWRVAGSSPPLPLENGATLLRKKVDGPEKVDLRYVVFDASRCRLGVVDQASSSNGGSLSLQETMRAAGAIAGCNGGYFTPDFEPLGLVISRGRRSGHFEVSSLLGGVLVARKGRPILLWRDEFKDGRDISDLLQAGPRLVSDGRPVSGLEGSKRRARTFLATDGRGHWAMGLCEYASLHALARMLASREIISELPVQRALNLDGGSSSGLWWRDATGDEGYARETASVRNFVGLFGRP